MQCSRHKIILSRALIDCLKKECQNTSVIPPARNVCSSPANDEEKAFVISIATAFISTDPFAPTYPNGWHAENGHRVFTAQPSQPLKTSPDYEAELDQLWQDIAPARREIQRVVVYFDLTGAKELLERLKRAGFEPREVIFVLCECESRKKTLLLLEHGFGSSVKHRSQCGVDVITSMFYTHLDHGVLEMAS